MSNHVGILEDLDRCVGCYACRLACEQENNLREGKSWINVVTLGPKTIFGKKSAEYFVTINENCHMCLDKRSKDLEPPCVRSCITKALKFCDTEGIIRLLKTEKKRYQICKVLNKNNTIGSDALG